MMQTTPQVYTCALYNKIILLTILMEKIVFLVFWNILKFMKIEQNTNIIYHLL